MSPSDPEPRAAPTAVLEGQRIEVLDPATVKRESVCLAVKAPDCSFRVEDTHTSGCSVTYDRPLDASHNSKDQGGAGRKHVNIIDHPYLANRYLTHPRVSYIEIYDDEYGFLLVKADNYDGVTVHDVYGEMTAS